MDLIYFSYPSDFMEINFSIMSSQVANPIWASFPLIKFSHHTGPNGTRSHNWTHINYRNDLKLVLRDIRIVDDYGNYENRSWMKVAGGTEVLESQDLSQLVNLSQECTSSSGVERPIEIVVRSPFLAMRYPKSANSVRRIQVKFLRESDFSQVVQLLTQLGLSVLDKDISKSGPAAIAGSVPTRLASSNTRNINMALQRPSSTSLMPFPISESSSHGITYSSPIKSSFSNQIGSDSLISEECRLTHEAKFYTSNKTRPFSANSSTSNLIQASPFPVKMSYHETEHSCPSLFLSQKQIEGQNRHMSQPIIPDSSLGVSEPTKKNKFQFPQSQEQTAETYLQFENKNDLLTNSSLCWTQAEDGNFWGTQTTEIERNHNHKISSLTQGEDEQNIWIPPKRKLPFSKSQDQLKASSVSIKDLPPLPKPTPVTKSADRIPSLSSTKKIATGKKNPPRKTVRKKSTVVKSLKKTNSIKDSESRTKQNEKSSATIALQESLGRPNQEITRPETNRRSTTIRHTKVKKNIKMLSQGTQTSDYLEPDDPPNQRNNTTKINETEHLAERQAHESCSGDNLKLIQKSIVGRGRASHKELCDTPGYAEASDDIRHSLIQDFICESLNNEDFLQLCKDIEFSWQRVCLGM